MKLYKVEIIMKLDGNPDKWIPDAIWECLEPHNGEDVLKYRFTEVNEEYEEIV